ncbi:hypothetical protein ASF69_01695 [Rhizobium sp. Leaf311]|uniref:abortive infection system antitoxin AbiGi family protein n=1 Tax=Rhizobium sp. Leaf311 TaxID=1736332 RepID=UPI0007146461|nr:abortive infection system antitoxin AbiGi family protein [Rhizobium sp. Leaf311]KQQ61163.1 hypothetical protein ASF69_01695 [Rhizobium sp. Leaf311]
MAKLVGNWSDDWLDMSPFVVHFAKPSEKSTAYDNCMSILAARRIEARSKFGTGKNHPAAPKSVCFSEIPLHHLSRLASKRGPYGIGFRKEFLVSRNGGPIMYAYKDTAHASTMTHLVLKAKTNPSDPIWDVAPFVDQPGKYGSVEYFYEWEREWRHVGHFDFKETDAAFLIIPEDDHSVAREYFAEAEYDNRGPNYRCPYIDPYWTDEQVKAAFNETQP